MGDGGSNGDVGLEVTVTPNRFWCDGDGGDLPLLIAIDTDQNPDTGSAFYGTEVELAWSPPANSRGEPSSGAPAAGTSRPHPSPRAAWAGSAARRSAGISSIPRALGITPTSGFNVVAATVSPHTDTAPDIGTFNYQPVAGTLPPKLGPDTRAPHVVTYPAKAVHGKLVTLTYQTLDGRGKTADTIRIYRGKRLLKTIRRPLGDSNPFELSHVSWRVPRSLHGRLRFSVRSADTAGNESNLSWASLSIR